MKTLTETAVTDKTVERTLEGVAQVGIGIMFTVSGLIGVWATACLISAVSTSGGVVDLARMWITAVTGV